MSGSYSSIVVLGFSLPREDIIEIIKERNCEHSFSVGAKFCTECGEELFTEKEVFKYQSLSENLEREKSDIIFFGNGSFDEIFLNKKNLQKEMILGIKFKDNEARCSSYSDLKEISFASQATERIKLFIKENNIQVEGEPKMFLITSYYY